MTEILKHYGLILINCIILLLTCNILWNKKLLTQIIIASIISLLLTFYYSLLNAPDVAMTEAAVNAAIETIFSLAALKHIKILHTSRQSIILITFLIILCSIIFGQLWQYFIFGSNLTTANQMIAQDYIFNTINDIGSNSLVAAILASYRGFDTLCETIVIFIAGLCVTCILSISYNPEE